MPASPSLSQPLCTKKVVCGSKLDLLILPRWESSTSLKVREWQKAVPHLKMQFTVLHMPEPWCISIFKVLFFAHILLFTLLCKTSLVFQEVVFAPGPTGKDNSRSDPKNILICSDTPGLKTWVVFLMENILLEITSFVLILKGIIFSIETRELWNKLLFCNFQFLSLRNWDA